MKLPGPDEERSGYASFLLRLWLSKEAGEWVWRASLTGVADGKLEGFTSLEALFRRIEQITAEIHQLDMDGDKR